MTPLPPSDSAPGAPQAPKAVQDTRPQTVECPICKAGKGEPCVRFSRELQEPHAKRYAAAGISYWPLGESK